MNRPNSHQCRNTGGFAMTALHPTVGQTVRYTIVHNGFNYVLTWRAADVRTGVIESGPHPDCLDYGRGDFYRLTDGGAVQQAAIVSIVPEPTTTTTTGDHQS